MAKDTKAGLAAVADRLEANDAKPAVVAAIRRAAGAGTPPVKATRKT